MERRKGSKLKIGGLRFSNIESALEEEETALTKVHSAVSKQLRRLQVEEKLLVEMLRQAEAQEAADAAGTDQQQEQQQQLEGQQRHQQQDVDEEQLDKEDEQL